jgi:hypothetical protein
LREEGPRRAARTDESRRTTTDGKTDAKSAPRRSMCIFLQHLLVARVGRRRRGGDQVGEEGARA